MKKIRHVLSVMLIICLLGGHASAVFAKEAPCPEDKDLEAISSGTEASDVTWDHIVQILAGEKFTVGLRSDGRVVYAGDQLAPAATELNTWRNIERIELRCPYSRFLIGYDTDGHVLLTDMYAAEDEDDVPVIKWRTEMFSDWEGIIDFIIDTRICVGLRSDGTVVVKTVSDGAYEDDAKRIQHLEEAVSSWHDIRQIATFGMDQYRNWQDYLNPYVIVGLQNDGRVITTDDSYFTESEKPDHIDYYYYPMEAWPDPSEWENVEKLVFGRWGSGLTPFIFGIRKDGSVLGMAEEVQNVDSLYFTMNCFYALTRDGHVAPLSCIYEDVEEQVSTWSDIAQLACGINNQGWFTDAPAGLRKDGTVIPVSSEFEEYWIDASYWSNIIRLKYDGYYLIGLCENGSVFATGPSAYINASLEEVNTWEDMADVISSGAGYFLGTEHYVGLRTDGTVAAVGNNDFGQCNVN